MPEEQREGAFAKRTMIMGVINLTPDSFFDGGRHANASAARAHAAQLLADGADWLDIGGESTRPGAAPVSPEEECARVLSALEAIQDFGARISIDTYRAETARRALALGASMVNDISGLREDPGMPAVVAEAGCDCVVMHMQGSPRTMQDAPAYADVVSEVCAFFEERLTSLTSAGIREERIWLDPGFGFGKTVDHNLTMLRRLREFTRFGRPVLIGTSNKSMIGAVLGLPLNERMEGTAATVACAIVQGASCVRVHDVRTMARVARMCDAIVHGREGQENGG